MSVASNLNSLMLNWHKHNWWCTHSLSENLRSACADYATIIWRHFRTKVACSKISVELGTFFSLVIQDMWPAAITTGLCSVPHLLSLRLVKKIAFNEWDILRGVVISQFKYPIPVVQKNKLHRSLPRFISKLLVASFLELMQIVHIYVEGNFENWE